MKLGTISQEITDMLRAIYVNTDLKKSFSFKWFKCFKDSLKHCVLIKILIDSDIYFYPSPKNCVNDR